MPSPGIRVMRFIFSDLLARVRIFWSLFRRRRFGGLILTGEIRLNLVPVVTQLPYVFAEAVYRQCDDQNARGEEPEVQQARRPQARVELFEAYVECREAYDRQHQRYRNEAECNEDFHLTGQL